MGFKIVVVLVFVVPLAGHYWKRRFPHRRLSQRVTWIVSGEGCPRPATVVDDSDDLGVTDDKATRSRVARIRTTGSKAAVDPSPWSTVFRVTFMVLFVAYPGVSLKILRLFTCRTIDGTSWLVADMRLQCYTREWSGLAVYAVVMAVVYVAGLPLATFGLLLRQRRLGRLFPTQGPDPYGFLYEVYGPSAWWWEVEELVRKLLLSAVVVLIEPGSPLQVCALHVKLDMFI